MKKILALIASFALPVVALAQQANFNSSPTALGILQQIKNILNFIIPILVILGVIYFIWGVISYVMGKSEEAKSEGRNRMIYGIIGLFVIVSIWGLVGVLGSTFNINNQGGTLNTNQLPQIQ
jgi:hypothetical protein